MSANNSQAVSELIKLLAAQQQQQGQQQLQHLPYQPQSEMPPPAQVQTSNNSSLNQLMDFLRTSGSNTAPAPAVLKPKPSPDDIHAQLQRYLQGGGQNQDVAQVPSPAFQNNLPAGGLGGNQNGYFYQPPQVPQQRVQQPQQAQVQQQSLQPLLQALTQQNGNIGLQQQLYPQQETLLSNIKLLADINPGMAVSALNQALNMSNPPPPPQQQMQPQTQAQQPFDLQLHNQGQAQQILGAQAPSPFVSSHQPKNHHPAPATFGSPFSTQATASMNPKTSNVNVNQNQGVENASKMKQLERIEAHSSAENHQEAKAAKKKHAKKAKNVDIGSANTVHNSASSMAAVPVPAPAVVPSSVPIHTPGEEVLQHWNLEKLETHVTQLKLARQPVPRHVAVLLFNARRREEKLKAKRISNRKSASVLRAKKKIFIEKMMKCNNIMRKKAMILQKMPDLVIATKLNGQITFCGSQVEHFLKYKHDDLLEANILDLVVPESRRTLQQLIQHLADPGQVVGADGRHSGNRRTDGADGKGNNSNGSSDANVVSLRSSEKSFPMLEVNVDAKQEPSNADDDVSDSSADNCRKRKHTNKGNGVAIDVSSLTRQKSSFADSSSGNDDSGDSSRNKKVKIAEKVDSDGRMSSSNTASSKTSDEETMALKPSIKTTLTVDQSHPNNTDSRRSQNAQKKGEDEVDDSGNREYNVSPEDSFSSFDTEKGENTRKRRLVPVYKVRFVCNDLTTVWCELTSSFCAKTTSDDDDSSFDPKAALEAINNPRGLKSLEEKDEPEEEEEEDELLFCIRPTYKGRKASEECRFVPKAKSATVEGEESMTVSDQKSSSTPTSSSGNEIGSANASHPTGETKQSSPLKKRPIVNDDTQTSSDTEAPSSKKEKTSSGRDIKAAESLLELHSK